MAAADNIIEYKFPQYDGSAAVAYDYPAENGAEEKQWVLSKDELERLHVFPEEAVRQVPGVSLTAVCAVFAAVLLCVALLVTVIGAGRKLDTVLNENSALAGELERLESENAALRMEHENVYRADYLAEYASTELGMVYWAENTGNYAPEDKTDTAVILDEKLGKESKTEEIWAFVLSAVGTK